MLFFKAYESAEIRFIHQYLNPNLPVIELGSSLGGVSCQIGLILPKNATFLCVEANPSLISTLKQNLTVNNVNSIVINKAIGNGSNILFEQSENNLVGQASVKNHSDKKSNKIEVSTISLVQLCREYHITDFNFVCDIEGAEIQILLDEPEAFVHIQHFIIELHETFKDGFTYSVKDLVSLINKLSFETIDSYGNVFYFKKIAKHI
tara:strand:- start:1092 stop:1709 length:618 start_codon:yes stop_codon:yes gene_type:complete